MTTTKNIPGGTTGTTRTGATDATAAVGTPRTAAKATGLAALSDETKVAAANAIARGNFAQAADLVRAADPALADRLLDTDPIGMANYATKAMA